jgi:hypothetical protein
VAAAAARRRQRHAGQPSRFRRPAGQRLMIPRTSRDWMAVLWPSFVTACLVEMVVFASFDPQDWHFFGFDENQSAETVYSVAFFCFWAVTALASLGTWNLTLSATALNRLTGVVPAEAAGTRDEPALKP